MNLDLETTKESNRQQECEEKVFETPMGCLNMDYIYQGSGGGVNGLPVFQGSGGGVNGLSWCTVIIIKMKLWISWQKFLLQLHSNYMTPLCQRLANAHSYTRTKSIGLQILKQPVFQRNLEYLTV
jgi:hypothetical protein